MLSVIGGVCYCVCSVLMIFKCVVCIVGRNLLMSFIMSENMSVFMMIVGVSMKWNDRFEKVWKLVVENDVNCISDVYVSFVMLLMKLSSSVFSRNVMSMLVCLKLSVCSVLILVMWFVIDVYIVIIVLIIVVIEKIVDSVMLRMLMKVDSVFDWLL